MSLTTPSSQSTVGKSAAVIIQPVKLFQDTNNEWVATTSPADAIGRPTGFLIVDGDGDLAIDTAVSSGLRAAITPSGLLAY